MSGSDLKESRYTKQLKAAGIDVRIGHDPANLPGGPGRDDASPDVVVVSTAILDNNPELIAAKERGLAIWHRAQMLAHLGRDLETLAVAGTHGKTTTSSMLASVLDAMGEDPTFLIGGIVRSYGTNAHSGSGRHYVVEADESDKSFTYLSPRAVLVTNIEADHLDHYRDLDEIYEKFAAFIGSVPADGGVVVACGDDEQLAALARAAGRTLVTYGFCEGCDARIVSFEPHGVGSDFVLALPDGRQLSAHVKQNPGRHNVLNAAGVIVLADALGMDAEAAARAMAGFAGVRRRFDLVGEAAGVTVVDDYAHHPTEIAATIDAAVAARLRACARAVPAAPLLARAAVHRGAEGRVRQRVRRGRHRHVHGRVPGGRGARARRERQDVPERGAGPCGAPRGGLRAAPRGGGAVPGGEGRGGRPGHHHGRGRRDGHRAAARGRARGRGRRGGRRSRRRREVRRAVSARHTTELEALLVDDRFDGDVYPAEPMARHTMYRIGGPARFYVQTASVGALVRLVEVCERTGVPWVVVGRGSNLLVADEGFPGVVVTLGRDFRTCRFDEEAGRFCVGAGVPLSSVVQEAFRRSLAGLEFAVGTPGTVGGALRMNAGSRDEWIGARVASVTTLSPGRGLARRAGDEIGVGLPHQLVRGGRGHRGMRTFRRAGRSVLHPR